MESLLFLCFFALCTYIPVKLSGLIARWLKKPHLKKYFVIIGLLVVFGDIPLAEIQANYLCSRPLPAIDNAEPLNTYKIHHKHGCDTRCIKGLLDYKIKDIITHVDDPKKSFFTDQKGYYIFSLSNIGDKNCRLYEAGKSLRNDLNIPKEKCIASRFYAENNPLKRWYRRELKKSYHWFLNTYKKKQVTFYEEKTNLPIESYGWYFVKSSWVLNLFEGSVYPHGHWTSCDIPSTYRYPDFHN